MSSMKRSLAAFLVVIACCWLFQARPTLAADRYWVGGSGDWSDPANWSATAGGLGGAGAPGVDDKVFLLQADAADRIVTYSAAGPGPELGDLNLDATGSGTMTLAITGGELLPNVMRVGSDGTAAVTQTGGIVSPDFGLYVGWDAGSSGAYDLQAGQLTKSSTFVGKPSIGGVGGSFLQSGGTHDTDSLVVDGQYHLEGAGVLTAKSVRIGGTFSQTGGSHAAGKLAVQPGGRYEWGGGSLDISYGWVIGSPGRPSSQFIFPSSPSSLSINGIVDFGPRTLTNAGNVSVTLGPESLLIHDAGDDPAADFGSFTNQGMTHVRGTTLSIPAGKTVSGAGSIGDPTDVWGTIDAAEDRAITLSNTVTIHPGAYLKGVELKPTSEPSVMYGGRLEHAWINSATAIQTAGRFVQYDGVIDHGVVRIWGYKGDESVYEMHGGTLSTQYFQLGALLGLTGPSRFEQTGGDVIHGVDTFYPMEIYSGAASATATYVMSGGTLHAMNSLYIGHFADGHGALHITNPTVGITIGWSFLLGKTAEFEAVSGTSIHLDDARFDVQGSDPVKVAGLENLTLIFEGDPAEAKSFEVAGLDLGAILAGYDANFALDTLRIGGDGGHGWA
ncbi:MAG: hypothetical protein IT441_10940, partial [Phycisphaeraceae bacterium]|nr:hypothetical protein [Phycisphaeraceae bacterium]